MKSRQISGQQTPTDGAVISWHLAVWAAAVERKPASFLSDGLQHFLEETCAQNECGSGRKPADATGVIFSSPCPGCHRMPLLDFDLHGSAIWETRFAGPGQVAKENGQLRKFVKKKIPVPAEMAEGM